ncbi:type II secretion system minor pseudopilin GspK [Thiomonas sp.]|jgi:general secretion pathway protein K|uniref:type II secretion system minor pseudopilin GspK n=1 Tax=Thiomonas sp. TaxID=2047785 RepID=UPI0026053451|nr:type II secretion system minor pseudopilin GspK [Thiomonas sp.]
MTRLPRPRRGAQRGAALITALLLAALSAVMVSGMLWREWGAIQREQAARESEQARWLLRGAVDWARLILNEAARNSSVVALDQPWAVPLAEADLGQFLAAGQTSSLGQVWLEGRIEDAQSRFNLTDLAQYGKPWPSAVEALQRLCSELGLNPALATRIAQAMAQAQAGSGDTLPIRELPDLARLSPDIAAALPRLAPYVTVLPTNTSLNANTASAPLLAAMLDISEEQAARLVATRARGHFADYNAIRAALGSDAAPGINYALVGVGSSYFDAIARVRIGDFEYAERALIQRVGTLSMVLRMQRVAPWLADPQSRQ